MQVDQIAGSVSKLGVKLQEVEKTWQSDSVRRRVRERQRRGNGLNWTGVAGAVRAALLDAGRLAQCRLRDGSTGFESKHPSARLLLSL